METPKIINKTYSKSINPTIASNHTNTQKTTFQATQQIQTPQNKS